MDQLNYDPTVTAKDLPPHIRENLSHPLFLVAWIEELGLAREGVQRIKARLQSSLRRRFEE